MAQLDLVRPHPYAAYLARLEFRHCLSAWCRCFYRTGPDTPPPPLFRSTVPAVANRSRRHVLFDDPLSVLRGISNRMFWPRTPFSHWPRDSQLAAYIRHCRNDGLIHIPQPLAT